MVLVHKTHIDIEQGDVSNLLSAMECCQVICIKLIPMQILKLVTEKLAVFSAESRLTR